MNGKHALGRLIEKVQQENSWSDRDLAVRAKALELDLGKSNWSRLKNQPVLTFKPSHIRGLASVLRQTETAVASAALESMGIELEGFQDGDVVAAVRNNSELSKRDKNVMLAVFRELAKGSDGNVSTAPITRAGESPAADAELTQDELDWAAYTTGRESQGRRLRRLQDEAAEAGQDYEDAQDLPDEVRGEGDEGPQEGDEDVTDP